MKLRWAMATVVGVIVVPPVQLPPPMSQPSRYVVAAATPDEFQWRISLRACA
jgi:hypothetical protein